MSMNIKNEQTHELARELASLTGESVTMAVTVALKERLERVRGKHEGLSERLQALGRKSAEHVDKSFSSADIDDLLYDEVGLPK